MASPNPNFNALLTSTLKRHRSKLTDNITDNNALLAQLKSHGFVREEPGSESIVENLMYAENSTVGSFGGWDILDLTPQDNITAAVYQWKHLAGTITITDEELFKNSGSRTRIFNLLEAKIRNLQISMEHEVSRQLAGDGTGNGGKNLTGLNILVEDGGAWSSVGNIDASVAANAFWRNQWADFSGTSFETDDGKGTEGVKQLRTIANKASRGKDRPTLILTAREVFEAYMATLGDKKRFTNTTMADMGFENILFDNIPMVWDDDVPTDDSSTDFTAWVLNSNYLKFVIGEGRNMHSSEFQEPSNQAAMSSKTLFYANLVLNQRARQGRLTNITV